MTSDKLHTFLAGIRGRLDASKSGLVFGNNQTRDDLRKLVRIVESLLIAHESIANFVSNSVDKVALIHQAEGYKNCSRRALDAVQAMVEGE